ncbi:lipoprotein [Streptomyces californicus]|uniref:lipoprotein n=1 Tax=Streptomyces californicus TaxID=67351 RepID=UPI0036C1D219
MAAMALAGCSSSPGGAGAGDGASAGPSASGAPAKAAEKGGADGAGAKTGGADGAGAEKAVAKKGGRLGGAGSACELPVTFDLAAAWKPKKIEVGPVDKENPLAEALTDLTEQGTVRAVCEINAKPAGNIGFLRVWQGDASDRDDPRAVLKAFTADDSEVRKATYAQVEAGELAAAEVEYTVYSELLEEEKPQRAFAVSTPDGPVVVHLGGMDTEEHTAMLPAYELAKRSVKLG